MRDDWFSRITGFDETDGYDAVQARLRVEGEHLISAASTRRTRCGQLELVSLADLRQRAGTATVRAGTAAAPQPNLVSTIRGEARELHRVPEYIGAVFQVASQFNLLEMVGPDVTPEHGVARYEHDRTQGPACAIAAGAATIYRNYLVPVEGRPGQTAARQLDGLADLGAALATAVDLPVDALWRMRNGYALCTGPGLDAVARHLDRVGLDERDRLRARLRIGLHRDVEVTDVAGGSAPLVTHALCSALPVAYGEDPRHPGWEPFARLVLEATYEATLLAGVLNARRGVSRIVLLTLVGGGVFGNREDWIEAAMRHALTRCAGHGLDVRIVSYGAVPAWLERMVAEGG